MKKIALLKMKSDDVRFIRYYEKFTFKEESQDIESFHDKFEEIQAADDRTANGIVNDIMENQMIPRKYIEKLRGIGFTQSVNVAFLVYRKMKYMLNFNKNVINNRGVIDFSDYEENYVGNEFSEFFDTNDVIFKGRIEISEYSSDMIFLHMYNNTASENNYKFDMLLYLDHKNELIAYLKDELKNTKYVDVVVGYNMDGRTLTLCRLKTIDDKIPMSLFLSYNPIDVMTYITSDKINEFVKNFNDGTHVKCIERRQMDNTSLYRFIEEFILPNNFETVYTQALVPYTMTGCKKVIRSYPVEHSFLTYRGIAQFEIMLRCVNIIFDINIHSSVRVQPYKKLFNNMEKIKRSKKQEGVDFLFGYITQKKQKWEDEIVLYEECGKKIPILRRNNDMMVLLITLYDEGVGGKRVKTVITNNLSVFRKTDKIIKVQNDK